MCIIKIVLQLFKSPRDNYVNVKTHLMDLYNFV